MVFENNYPQKIKGLIDELKYAKEKYKELEDEIRKEKKHNNYISEQNILLTERVRSLNGRKHRKADGHLSVSMPAQSIAAKGDLLSNRDETGLNEVEINENLKETL